MVVIGVDAHKRSHTFVALDERAARSAKKWSMLTMPGTATPCAGPAGRSAQTWYGGVEDCRQVSARLKRDLLIAGQQAVRVPPRLMARTRASARTRGKSDPIDELAVARAVLREPDLPVARYDDASAN